MITRFAIATLAFFATFGAHNSDPNADLLRAADKGDVAKVRAALTSGADVDTRNKNGYTALLLAASHGHTEVLRVLIDAHADLEAVPPPNAGYGETLHTRPGSGRIVRELLAHGADRTIASTAPLEGFSNGRDMVVSGHGLTALMMASFGGYDECVVLLLAGGAKVNAVSTEGYSALMFAVLESNRDAIFRAGATAGDLVNTGSEASKALESLPPR